jgi:hypothetical protein
MAIEIDMKNVAKKWNVEIKLKNIKQWRFRVWVGTKIIELAAWVLWSDIEIEFTGDEK